MSRWLMGVLTVGVVLVMVHWASGDTLIQKSGGAPTSAPYLVHTPVAQLPNAQALSALTSGCLGSAVSTGIVATRTILGTTNEITVTNGNCVSNPTLSLPATINLGGKTSLEIPNGSSPTTDAFGELAGDSNAWAASRGAVQFFDGTATTYLLGVVSSDTPANGECPKFNTGGTITWESCSGGGSAVGASTAVQGSNGAGGLTDTGCTGAAGVMTCSEFKTTGGSIGLWVALEGAAPGAAANAGEHNIYVSSATNRLASHENAGTAKDYVAAADTQTLTNKTINGSNNTIVIKDEYWWDLAGCVNATAGSVWNLPTSNAATAGCDTGTNQFSAYMEFADAANQSLHGSFILTKYDAAGIDWNFRYFMSAGTTNAVGLCVQLVRLPVSTSRDPAFPALSTSNCTSNTIPATAGQEKVATITGVTCASCVAGDRVMFRISRDGNGTAVTDSATGVVRMTYSGPAYGRTY